MLEKKLGCNASLFTCIQIDYLDPYVQMVRPIYKISDYPNDLTHQSTYVHIPQDTHVICPYHNHPT